MSYKINEWLNFRLADACDDFERDMILGNNFLQLIPMFFGPLRSSTKLKGLTVILMSILRPVRSNTMSLSAAVAFLWMFEVRPLL
jgi:hypothetical protein